MNDTQRVQMIREILNRYSDRHYPDTEQEVEAFYDLMDDVELALADTIVVDLGESNV